jgi:serine/threonine protein kinase
MENISVALSIDNQFFIWGKCGKEVHSTPIQINCHTFDEVFLNFTDIQYEPRADLIKFNDWLFRYGYYENEFKEIGKEIAHGSFGRVHKVINKNGKYFAIKIVEPSDGYEKEFLREYVNQNRVNKLMGKFFVKQFDSWFESKRNEKNSGLTLYIKMELCDKTLNEVMNEIDFEFFRKDDKILSPIGYYIASDIFIEILRGVLCLHQHNIIHRDLNPSNILFKKEETGEITVKIADYGLSVLHELSDQSHTKDRGTPKYMAPEVPLNTKYDTKADIYSLGIILENLFKIETIKYEID